MTMLPLPAHDQLGGFPEGDVFCEPNNRGIVFLKRYLRWPIEMHLRSPFVLCLTSLVSKLAQAIGGEAREEFQQERSDPKRGFPPVTSIQHFQSDSPASSAPLFERVVETHQGDRHSRGFRCWDQFVAMLFCRLRQTQSLREIYEGLQASEGKLVHLRMDKAPRHSTLASANQHRLWEIYRDLFTALLAHLRASLPVSAKTPLELHGKLYSLDSTLIDLCAKVFDWAKYRTAKGAVKIHLLLDHDGLLPEFAIITDGKAAGIGVARKFSFLKGSMDVFDRGYCDYDWFAGLSEKGVHFVTRLKDNASWVSVEFRPVPADSNVRRDDIVVFYPT